MLEDLFGRTRGLPANQDSIKQKAFDKAWKILEEAGVEDLPPREKDIQGIPYKEEIIENSLFIYNVETGEVEMKSDGRKFRLTPTLNKLLTVFTHNPNRVLSTQALESAIWDDYSSDISIDKASALRNYIKKLRRHLEPEARKGNYKFLVTYPWRGYMLGVPEMP